MTITRYLEKDLSKNLNKQKVSLLVGSRRSGKTKLLHKIYKEYKGKKLWLEGEDLDTEELLAKRSIAHYSRLLQGVQLLIIDEAHYITDITQKAKLMIDQIKPLHIILSGSSSFDLVQKGAPLVGRSYLYQMHPIAYCELQKHLNLVELKQNLENLLIYGSYPELYQLESNKEKELYLKDLVNTYLLKDILQFENIRNAQKIKDLLKLIAYQIGSESSLDELGKQLGISKNTVQRYIDLMEKAFIIHHLNGFSRNLRKEIVKTKKYYFVDNGLRNALINDFRFLDLRQDKGVLWEQFLINERIKKQEALLDDKEWYFWRTYDQQEIDLIEVNANKTEAFEFKWNNAQKIKIPKAFEKAYPEARFTCIDAENFEEFIAL